MLLCATAQALDTSRLWLPKSYQTLFLPLVKAAQTAEELERCVTVLEGTLDLQQSEPEHPIYRILCRQENGRSYNEMVDGLDFATLTTQERPEPELSAEQKERLRQAEQARAAAERERRKQSLWQLCHAAIMERSAMMIDMHWLSDPQPEPLSFDEQQAVFVVDFDAKSVWGKALQYRARCTAEVSGAVDLQLLKRGN